MEDKNERDIKCPEPSVTDPAEYHDGDFDIGIYQEEIMDIIADQQEKKES